MLVFFCLCVLVCEECSDFHHGDCPVHGPLKQLDPSKTRCDVDSKKHTSIPVPDCFTIRMSSIPDAGLGVFATKHVPSGVRFGPYEGDTVFKSELTDSTDTSYMWEVQKYMYMNNTCTFIF